MSGKLELKHLSKPPYFEDVNFSFDLKAGNIAAVNGLSSPAMTALMKVISGIEEPEKGELLYNNTSSLPVFPLIPKLPSSFPWLSVKGNIDAVPDKKLSAEKAINIVGLKGYEDYFPSAKSIGFRFRISLARALALEPALILLDDCFDGLDTETKNELFELIKKISAEQKVTFLYAASNLYDAEKLSGEVIKL